MFRFKSKKNQTGVVWYDKNLIKKNNRFAPKPFFLFSEKKRLNPFQCLNKNHIKMDFVLNT